MNPSPEVPSEVASEVSEVGLEVPEATPNASEVSEVRGIVGIEGPELLIPRAIASAFDIYRERRKP